MERLHPIFFLFLLGFIIPQVTFAVEGTCSWHGGVNCSAGPDWDRSAICNDGWRDSSENYFSNLECRNSNRCTTLEYDAQKSNYPGYDARVQKAVDIISEINGLSIKRLSIPIELEESVRGRGVTIGGLTPKIDGALRQNNYAIIKLKIELDHIVSQLQKETDSINESCLSIGENRYNSQLEKLRQELEANIQQKENYTSDVSCKDLNGQFSHYDSDWKKCFCDTGYTYNNGQCRSADSVCQNRIGAGSRASWATDVSGSAVFSCECKTGYTLNASDKCEVIPKPTAKISERALNVAKLDGRFFRCDSADLTEQEKSECGSYRLHSDLYSWEIYNKSAEPTPKLNQQQTVLATPPVIQVSKAEETSIKTAAKPFTGLSKPSDFKISSNSPATTVRLKKDAPSKKPESDVSSTTKAESKNSVVTATSNSIKKEGLFSRIRSFVSSFWK